MKICPLTVVGKDNLMESATSILLTQEYPSQAVWGVFLSCSSVHRSLSITSYRRRCGSVFPKYIHILSDSTLPHPQLAFTASLHGISNKWGNLSLTSPNIDHLFQPLEDAIREKFYSRSLGPSQWPDSQLLVITSTSWRSWVVKSLFFFCLSHNTKHLQP